MHASFCAVSACLSGAVTFQYQHLHSSSVSDSDRRPFTRQASGALRIEGAKDAQVPHHKVPSAQIIASKTKTRMRFTLHTLHLGTLDAYGYGSPCPVWPGLHRSRLEDQRWQDERCEHHVTSPKTTQSSITAALRLLGL